MSDWVDDNSTNLLSEPVALASDWILDDPYFLSLDPVVENRPDAATHWAAAGFASYGESPACPGAEFMALIVTPDSETKQEIIDSLYPDFWPQLRVPPLNLTRFGFELAIPEGWDAVATPDDDKISDALVALDCSTGAIVRE